ncbi:MAG: hypothetical protein Q7P63_12435 [Verrucomicrobiota bacterium JB022]|nr:hypothetical protein [Verrucomicrobiota bacterium JB022]
MSFAPGVLKQFHPESWFDPVGIKKVLKRLEPRLPDVSGALFLTLTIDRKLFGDPASAFEYTRNRLRKVFYRLRKGVMWKGKLVKIDAPYCVKVEFHHDLEGWPHFHVIFLTRRFFDGELLRKLWDCGRCDVKRISNEDFRYLLKYVVKGAGEVPEWVKQRKRIRIFQSSHGFLKPLPEKEEDEEPASECPPRRRDTSTIGERLEKWRKTALYITENWVQQFRLERPFREILDEIVLDVAIAGRYLGYFRVQINEPQQLHEWIT